MTLTAFPYGISSMGVPITGGDVPAMFGKYFFVDYTRGSDGNSGLSMDNAFSTLSKAHSMATGDDDDVVLVRGDDPVLEDAAVTWSKNKVHVYGLGAFGATDPEPRWKGSATGITADAAATLIVTGWANTFTNIRIVNEGTHANSVTALWDKGEGTVFSNCQFAKFSDLNVAAVSDVEARGDSTTWRNCKFGVDTLSHTATRPTLSIKGTGGSARMKNNVFENCYFTKRTTQAAALLLEVSSTNSLAFMNIWKECVFVTPVITSSSDVQLTNAVASVSGLVEGSMLFINPYTNAASFCTSLSARLQVIGSGHATANTNTVGIAVTPN